MIDDKYALSIAWQSIIVFRTVMYTIDTDTKVPRLVTSERNITEVEQHFALTVCRHETGFGTGWKPPGVGSHNWGAVQEFHGGPYFTYGDSHANGQKYQGRFKIYPDDIAGYSSAARIVLHDNVRNALGQNNPKDAVSCMRLNGYFEASLDSYIEALTRNYAAFIKGCGEPVLFSF